MCNCVESTCLHLLHIGKTGGTALKHALACCPHTALGPLVTHPHRVRLPDVPVGHGVVFFVREPLSRFVSGFYSRKRQGQPRYASPWSPAEARAFQWFDTPNSLARSLSSKHASERESAVEAMRSIAHVNTSYWDWMIDPQYFESRAADVVFIGSLENLDVAFEALKQQLRLDSSIRLPHDDLQSHRNPVDADRGLDEEATANLKQWYAADYEFLRICADHPRYRGQNYG